MTTGVRLGFAAQEDDEAGSRTSASARHMPCTGARAHSVRLERVDIGLRRVSQSVRAE